MGNYLNPVSGKFLKSLNVILAIKPQFAEKILSGKKRFEYRKAVFKQPVERVYIYASYPVCKIVGEFMMSDIIQDSPDAVWHETKEYAGIDYSYFSEYFMDRDKAYALCVGSYKKYRNPIDPKVAIEGFHAPQSFCYTSFVL